MWLVGEAIHLLFCFLAHLVSSMHAEHLQQNHRYAQLACQAGNIASLYLYFLFVLLVSVGQFRNDIFQT